MHEKASLLPRRRPRAAGLVVAAVLAAALTPPAHADDWLTFGHGLERHNSTSESFAPPLSLVWKFTTAPSDQRVPPVVTGDRVFCAAGSIMYGLDLATGGAVWSYDAGDDILAPPTYAGGRVFFGADNGKVICLNAADGKEVWALDIARAIRAGPAVVDGVVYAASLDWRVTAIDAATGARRWTTQLTDEAWGAPAVIGNMVLAPTADGQIFGLDLENGRIRLQVTLARRRALLHPVVVTENAMYVAGRSELNALTRRGGEMWVAQFNTFLTGAPAFANGRLYVSLIDGRVLALDAQRGKTLWELDFNTEMSSPPTAVGDVVLAGAVGGMVYAIEGATGAPRWRYLARPPGLAAGSTAAFELVAPAVYSNGSLYLIWDDGSLARFWVNGPDLVPPTIRMLTPPENVVTGTNLPKLIGAQVFDEGSGLDSDSLRMTLDDVILKGSYDPYTGYFTYTVDKNSPLAPLKRGWRTVSITARDQRGNAITRTWRFFAEPGAGQPTAAPAPAPSEPSGPPEYAPTPPEEIQPAPPEEEYPPEAGPPGEENPPEAGPPEYAPTPPEEIQPAPPEEEYPPEAGPPGEENPPQEPAPPEAPPPESGSQGEIIQ